MINIVVEENGLENPEAVNDFISSQYMYTVKELRMDSLIPLLSRVFSLELEKVEGTYYFLSDKQGNLLKLQEIDTISYP